MSDLISLSVTSQSIAVWVKKLCSFDAILYFSKEDNFLVLLHRNILFVLKLLLLLNLLSNLIQ